MSMTICASTSIVIGSSWTSTFAAMPPPGISRTPPVPFRTSAMSALTCSPRSSTLRLPESSKLARIVAPVIVTMPRSIAKRRSTSIQFDPDPEREATTRSSSPSGPVSVQWPGSWMSNETLSNTSPIASRPCLEWSHSRPTFLYLIFSGWSSLVLRSIGPSWNSKPIDTT